VEEVAKKWEEVIGRQNDRERYDDSRMDDSGDFGDDKNICR
jgi:hypothetical protein